MMEALKVQQNDEKEGDRQREYAKLEEWDEPIIQKMMGKEYARYFYLNDEGQDVRELAAIAEAQMDAERELEEEQNHKHYYDAMHGL